MIAVREAQADDAPEVARVHVRSAQVGYRGLLPDAYLEGLLPEDRMSRYTFGSEDPADPTTIVAVEDETIRGFATIGEVRDQQASNRGELLALYVDPAFWARGIGRRLIAEARTRLAACEFTEAVLWVLLGNARAMQFYRSDGWCPDGTERSVNVWGVGVDELRYVRRLP